MYWLGENQDVIVLRQSTASHSRGWASIELWKHAGCRNHRASVNTLCGVAIGPPCNNGTGRLARLPHGDGVRAQRTGASSTAGKRYLSTYAQPQSFEVLGANVVPSNDCTDIRQCSAARGVSHIQMGKRSRDRCDDVARHRRSLIENPSRSFDIEEIK